MKENKTCNKLDWIVLKLIQKNSLFQESLQNLVVVASLKKLVHTKEISTKLQDYNLSAVEDSNVFLVNTKDLMSDKITFLETISY